MNYRILIAAASLAAASLSFAQEGTSLQSDWLELVKGKKGETLGVELMDVQEDAATNSRTVTLRVPKSSMAHPDSIEEVVVMGQMPEKPEAPEPIDMTYHWLSDDNSEYYGLVIKLGSMPNWPIRLYMNSAPGYIEN